MPALLIVDLSAASEVNVMEQVIQEARRQAMRNALQQTVQTSEEHHCHSFMVNKFGFQNFTFYRLFIVSIK